MPYFSKTKENTEDFFLVVKPEKILHGKCLRKRRRKTFWTNLGIFGAKTLVPQKFACSYAPMRQSTTCSQLNVMCCKMCFASAQCI